MKPLLAALALGLPALHAQDVLFMKNGDKRVGQIVTADATTYRIQVPLPTPPGSQTPVAFASVSIPRADVEAIQFAPDPTLDQILRNPAATQIAELKSRWTKSLPWLSIPKSPAGRIGNTLASLLLKTGDSADAAQSLDLFKQIETAAWSEDDQMTARQGRLRAMVATGNAKDAVNEAEQLAAVTEDPAVLIEAKYILAEAAAASLKKLLADNPRWQEDINVIPERNRLYHEAIDLYLYPSLFVGSETEPAARGLSGAVAVYTMVDEPRNALECARDITIIYPTTKFAGQAAGFIASLPESQRAIDPEKEARDEQAPPADQSTPKTQKSNEAGKQKES
jgi:hypothetical protein